MSQKTIQSLTFPVTVAELRTLLARVKELNKIHDVHRMTISPAGIFFYSMLSAQNTVDKVKAYFLDNGQVFRELPHNVRLDYVIDDAKNWHKQFSLLLDTPEATPLQATILYDPASQQVCSLQLFNGELELRAVSGQLVNSITITPEKMREKIEPAQALWSATMTTGQLDKLRQLITVDREDLLTLACEGKEVAIRQTSWKQLLPAHDVAPGRWDHLLHRGHLAAITKPAERLTLRLYPTYLLVIEDESYTLLTLCLTD